MAHVFYENLPKIYIYKELTNCLCMGITNNLLILQYVIARNKAGNIHLLSTNGEKFPFKTHTLQQAFEI